METPDVTRAQLLAVVSAALAAAVAFGAPITPGQSDALLALAGAVSVVLLAADAAIRRKRAEHADSLALGRELARMGPDYDEPPKPPATLPKTADRPIRIGPPTPLAAEADAEDAAHAANAAAEPAPGVDPATLG